MLKRIISTKSTLYNWKLGCYLAFVAGAVNAGGFLAIGRYTSHMTGIASELADSFFLKNYALLSTTFFAIISFMFGAITTTLLINIGKFLRIKSNYAFVLFLEGIFILIFGILATYFPAEKLVMFYVLCFLMGFQNAIMTKISSSQIRTTHITGMVTDISIELGKWLAKLFLPARKYYLISINKSSLRLHSATLLMFIFGGICGAFGFGVYGYLYVIPLSVILLALAMPSLYHEIRLRQRFKKIRLAKHTLETVGFLDKNL